MTSLWLIWNGKGSSWIQIVHDYTFLFPPDVNFEITLFYDIWYYLYLQMKLHWGTYHTSHCLIKSNIIINSKSIHYLKKKYTHNLMNTAWKKTKHIGIFWYNSTIVCHVQLSKLIFIYSRGLSNVFHYDVIIWNLINLDVFHWHVIHMIWMNKMTGRKK